MGFIYERTQEHLGTTDSMVIRTRRALIRAAEAFAKNGTLPYSVEHPEVYAQRSGGVILPRHADWFEATKELRQARWRLPLRSYRFRFSAKGPGVKPRALLLSGVQRGA